MKMETEKPAHTALLPAGISGVVRHGADATGGNEDRESDNKGQRLNRGVGKLVEEVAEGLVREVAEVGPDPQCLSQTLSIM